MYGFLKVSSMSNSQQLHTTLLGADLELDFGGGPYCLYHVKSFLTLLFAIRNIDVWGYAPGSTP